MHLSHTELKIDSLDTASLREESKNYFDMRKTVYFNHDLVKSNNQYFIGSKLFDLPFNIEEISEEEALQKQRKKAIVKYKIEDEDEDEEEVEDENEVEDEEEEESSSSRHHKKIKLLPKSYILKQGNPLKHIDLWRPYHHYMIYKKGIPKEKDAIHVSKNDTRQFYLKNYAFKGYIYEPPTLCSVDKELCERSTRFPSVKERIKYYMGRWYNYDSSKKESLFNKDFYHQIQHKLDDNKTDAITNEHTLGRVMINPFNLSPYEMYKFVVSGAKTEDRNAKNYLRDFIDFSILFNSSNQSTVLFHYGDGLSCANDKLNRSYPVIGKVRDALAEKDVVNHWRYPPTKHCRQCGLKHTNIIWPLNRRRHFAFAANVPKNDRTFDKKIPMAIWRGRVEKTDLLEADLPIEISSWGQRMALVSKHLNSKKVNAKFTGKIKTVPKEYIGKEIQIKELLKYKYIISIEGNDVSSGLKWMLFSNSVVLMPHITWESWAMESYLQPFEHYIPIYSNMSNVEEMIDWAETHPQEVDFISKKSTLFIYDLLFHPDSFRDEGKILKGIVQRYEKLFGNNH